VLIFLLHVGLNRTDRWASIVPDDTYLPTRTDGAIHVGVIVERKIFTGYVTTNMCGGRNVDAPVLGRHIAVDHRCLAHREVALCTQ
jgi:hypothetical protein